MRNSESDMLDPYAKYETFKKAYDTLNYFTESGNLIGGFLLSFSILEDRLCATFLIANDALKFGANTNNISRIKFKEKVDQLFKMEAIDNDFRDRLMSAAALRNELTHKMMWRLNVFEKKHIAQFKKLINELKKCQRQHQKMLAVKL